MDIPSGTSEKANGKTVKKKETQEEVNSRLAKLSLAALGIVFGDISTSPIYAIRECFHGEYGIEVSQANVMGVLSLMFWALVLIVGLKYLIFVFRADNRGEGGVIALTALLRGIDRGSRRWGGLGIVSLGLFAACLLYGDGMITPAISVLSAVEGIGIITPILDPYVILITILILTGLFLLQKNGTARVGSLFGPVILIWLCFLAVSGAIQLLNNPKVLEAVFPWYAVEFFIINKLHGFVVLGAVFLVVTGTEALYADMGHFGKTPIRLTWFAIVFPALVINYFGQGALLLGNPEAAAHPFYALVPSWALIPTVLLATLATIIASQAVISGAFSLTSQAIQLGYLPRLTIRHTSATQIGQIYIAPVNWMLLFCTAALVAGFQSSSKLAAAYGVAVTSTMLITTTLFFIVARQRWHWPLLGVVPLTALFLLVDVSFFTANISKIFHGAWFPLAIGTVFFTLMLTWNKGCRIVDSKMHDITPTIEHFIADLDGDSVRKIDEDGIFLTGSRSIVPFALVKNIKHNNILHDRTILLNFKVEDIPRVPNLEKFQIEKFEKGFYSIVAHYGFMEEPQLERVLALADDQGLELDLEKISFYIGRENLVTGGKSPISRWRAALFIFMSRNETDATSFFRLPEDQVIEIGVRLAI